MLLASRRRALLTFCLAGLQMAWFTTYLMLLLPPAWDLPPLAVCGALLAILLCWVLLIEVLNRLRVPSPGYELSVTGLLIVSTLFFDRWLLYGGRPATDIAWLGQTVATLFSLTGGAAQLLVLIVANVFLWQRAAAFTSEEPTFFGTGMSFRLGLLLLLFGAALLQALGGAQAAPLLWVFFGFGLCAVALARIEDKSSGAQSAGSPLPVLRLGQLLLAVVLTVGVAALLAGLLNRGNIVTLVTWLGPLWRVLGFLLGILLTVLWWLLMPLFSGLEMLVRWLAQSHFMDSLATLADLFANQRRLLEQNGPPSAYQLPGWLTTGLRYLGVTIVLLLLAGMVLLFLDRVRGARKRREAEVAEAERISVGGGILATALDRLRQLAGLARRYGVSGQLLAAISVQNLYANVSRLARRRGYPRRPAEPPDAYLPTLYRAFPGQEPALERLTAAYMRVHYGDRPITLEELAALRADYHRVRLAARQGAEHREGKPKKA